MKQLFSHYFVICLLTILILLPSSCDKPSIIHEINISGYAQKGQLIKGADITAFGLDDKLIPTGESFPSVINDDLGSFDITGKIETDYLELKAEGYYFVENTGQISAAPIYLNALAEVTGKKINLNLLTTITSERIRNLLTEGMDFKSAKSKAEKEFITAIKFNSASFENTEFDELNIMEDGECNAMLLAFSLLLQEARTPGQIQNLISDIRSDFSQDGKLSMPIIKHIFEKAKEINISSVIHNLAKFYSEKSIDNYSIPPFWRYLEIEHNPIFQIISPNNVNGCIEIDSNKQEMSWIILSDETFTISTDLPWIKTEIEHISSSFYRVKLIAEKNEGSLIRSNHIAFKLASGESVFTVEIKQKEGISLRRLYLMIGGTTKSSTNDFPNQIMVNDIVYDVMADNGKFYVSVPLNQEGDYDVYTKSEQLSRLGVGKYKIELPHETIGRQMNVNSLYLESTLYEGHTYGISSSIKDIEIALTPIYAILKISIGDFSKIGKIVIESKGNILSGIVEAQVLQNSNISCKIIAAYDNVILQEIKTKEIYLPIFPQEIEGLKMIVYGKQGQVLMEKTTSKSFKIERGYILNLGTI